MKAKIICWRSKLTEILVPGLRLGADVFSVLVVVVVVVVVVAVFVNVVYDVGKSSEVHILLGFRMDGNGSVHGRWCALFRFARLVTSLTADM